ncbi:hypothetical protein N9W21_08395 [Shewanella sp.]|nr:hypothetical protein [Shewanella sp.]
MIDSDEENEIWTKYINPVGGDKDLDLVYAKKTFFKASRKKILASFSNSVINSADELRFMPNILFNKYFHFFIGFIISQEHDEFDADDVASCFTTLLNEKLDAKAIESKALLNSASNAINFLHDNIEFYNTNPDIYGDLESKLDLLQEKLLSYRV